MLQDSFDLESLLYESESETIDFKRAQYPFRGASDEDKGEIIKDILAFANAWKRSTSFILLGFSKTGAEPAKCIGIAESIDDAALQQLVNSKTNRPVQFLYVEKRFRKRKVAVISIPMQQRPVFLTKDFGKLKKHFVYVRRGSSTAIADPSEISEMGKGVGSRNYGVLFPDILAVSCPGSFALSSWRWHQRPTRAAAGRWRVSLAVALRCAFFVSLYFWLDPDSLHCAQRHLRYSTHLRLRVASLE